MTGKNDPNKYPRGMDRKQVEAIIDHYDRQTEDESIAEADAALENSSMTLVRVPNELVEKVEKFIAQHASNRKSA